MNVKRNIKKIIGLLLVVLVVFNVKQIAAMAVTIDDSEIGYGAVWTTWSMYDEDECVSSQFGRKQTTADILLGIESSNGSMRMRAVGANSANPGWLYGDCSGGLSRTVVISSKINNGNAAYYYLPNYVLQYGYSYAGVLATSMVDSLVEARGIFYVR